MFLFAFAYTYLSVWDVYQKAVIKVSRGHGSTQTNFSCMQFIA